MADLTEIIGKVEALEGAGDIVAVLKEHAAAVDSIRGEALASKKALTAAEKSRAALEADLAAERAHAARLASHLANRLNVNNVRQSFAEFEAEHHAAAAALAATPQGSLARWQAMERLCRIATVIADMPWIHLSQQQWEEFRDASDALKRLDGGGQ